MLTVLRFSSLIFWRLPNLAKFTYGLLPLEQYHKIEKRKIPRGLGFFSSFFPIFLILKIFWGKNSRIYTTKKHFPENSQKIFSPKKDKIYQREGTNYWTFPPTPLYWASLGVYHTQQRVLIILASPPMPLEKRTIPLAKLGCKRSRTRIRSSNIS